MVNIFKLIWSAACYIGCLFYLYQDTETFFLRKTTSACTLARGFRPPGVTVCVPLQNLYCKDVNQINSCLEQLLNQSTELIFQKVPSVLSLVSDVNWFENAKPTSTREFLKNGQKCAQFRLDTEMFKPSYVIFTFNTSTPLKVYLNSDGHLPYGLNEHRYEHDKLQTGRYEYIRLHQMVNIGIPAPYDTNCFDYGQRSFQDQDHCIQACISNLTIHNVPVEFLIDARVSNSLLKHGTLNLKTQRKCFQKCSKPDCFQDKFTLLSRDLLIKEARNSNDYIFTLQFIILEFKVLIQYEPAYSFETYFTYAGGMTCLWLGLSSLSMEAILHYVFSKVPNHKKLLRTCKVSLYVFSGIGCIYQLVGISQQYFEYEINTELYLGTSIDREMPAVAICYRISDIINRDMIPYAECKESMSLQGQDIKCMNKLRKHNYAYINDVTLNVTQLFTSFRAFYDDGVKKFVNTEFGNLSKDYIEQYFKLGRKCFQFYVAGEYYPAPTVNYMEIDRISNMTYYKVPWIYLYKKNTYPRQRRHIAGNLWHSVKKGHTVIPQLIIENYLEYPFKSRCTPNNPPGLSADYYIENCMRKVNYNVTSFNDPSIVTSDQFNTTSANDHTNVNQYEAVGTKYYKLYRDFCMVAAYDCFTRKYEMIVTMDSSKSMTRVEPPKNMILFQEKIKLTSIEYLLYIASILGFWFDFTLFFVIAVANRIKQTDSTQLDISADQRLNNLVRLVARQKYRAKEVKFVFARNSVKTIIMFSLIMGCLTQLVNISKLYFQRDMLTRTTMTNPQNFKVPAISVCRLMCYNMKNTSISYKDCVEHMLSNYSAVDLNEVTYNFSDIVRAVLIRDSNSYDMINLNLTDEFVKTHVIQYYLDAYKCFTLTGILDNKEFNRKRLEFNRVPMRVVEYQLKLAGYYYFTMHRLNSFQRSAEMKYFSYSGLILNTNFEYSLASATLLPYPYATDCKAYKESREACYENCILKTYNEQSNISVSSDVVRQIDDSYAGDYIVHSITIVNSCKRACSKPDCNIQTITYTINSEKAWNVDVPGKFGFKVDGCRFETNSEYLPKLLLIDLIFYLGGLFGIWLGLNFMSLYEIVFWSLHKAAISFSKHITPRLPRTCQTKCH